MSRVASLEDAKRRKQLENDLDAKLDHYSYSNQQLFEDSPNKSELNQFGDFSGSNSQFDKSGSLERGMAKFEKSTDFSFKSKSAMPPMSTLSTLSSHSDSPRKTQSEGGRQTSFSRFSPMSSRKVTALGMHESESDYSPSKYYQPTRTPHAASRMNTQSTRKVSPKSFKSTAALFNDLGLDDTNVPAQSFRLPRDMPDLTGLLASARKLGHKEIESIPVSDDNQKLFAALQDMQITVESLERQSRDSEAEVKRLKESIKHQEEKLRGEQQRTKFAESELKQHLSNPKADSKALEARNETLANAVNATKKELENRTLELDLAREEMSTIEEERTVAIERLANALENVDRLQGENDLLRAQVLDLQDKLKKAPKASAGNRIDEQLKRVKKSAAEQQPVVEEVTDEAIEVSKSIINDSEIEELTKEIEELRRQKARAKRVNKVVRKDVPRKASSDVSKPKRKTKVVYVSSGEERRRPKTQVKIPILETTDEEISEASCDEFEEDLTTAEDEPSQILYRRKPARKRSTVNVQKVISKLSHHDIAKCTICSKKASKAKKAQTPAVDDANATIRPSQPPMDALTSVLSGLEDEFRHLKIKYHDLTSEYNSLSPSLGKRQRKTIANDLKSVIEALETKADQIYSIFDVLEVANGGIPLDEYQFEAQENEQPEVNTRRQWINT